MKVCDERSTWSYMHGVVPTMFSSKNISSIPCVRMNDFCLKLTNSGYEALGGKPLPGKLPLSDLPD